MKLLSFIKIEKKTNIIELFTLITLIAGGILGYFLVGKPTKEINTTLNLSDFIADIQPNLEINLQPKFLLENKILYLDWEITNIGKHTVVIDKIDMWLAPIHITKDTPQSSLLKDAVDYKVLIPSIGELPPNQKTHQSIEITLSDKVKLNKIYHYTKFHSEVHTSVKVIAQKLLCNYFDEDTINNLVRRSYGRHGWLRLKTGKETGYFSRNR